METLDQVSLKSTNQILIKNQGQSSQRLNLMNATTTEQPFDIKPTTENNIIEYSPKKKIEKPILQEKQKI